MAVHEIDYSDERYLQSAKHLKPLKLKKMLASRACRSAIMVGDPLNRPQMRKIADNLAKLQSPWNCPHGRPTMIKMASIKRQKTALYRNMTPVDFDK